VAQTNTTDSTIAPKPVTAGQRFLTPRQAAERLGVSLRTIESWRFRRVGPAFCKLGKSVRYSVDTLDAWAAAQAVASER